MAVRKTRKIGPAAGNRGLGRPKGARNKVTVALKDAILEAADQAGGEGGLTAYLKAQAIDNPGAFMALLGRILPRQLNIEETPMATEFEVIIPGLNAPLDDRD